MKNLDFIDVLADHLDTLDLYSAIEISTLDTSNTISLLALPGGVETVFMDGSKDKDYNLQINAKHLKQDECINTLNTIADALHRLQSLYSKNRSFEYDRFSAVGMPSFVSQDEQGFWIWQLTATAQITIFREVNE